MPCCETRSTQRFPSSSSAAAITAAPPPQLTEPKGSASRCPSVTGVPQKPKAELDTTQNPGWRLQARAPPYCPALLPCTPWWPEGPESLGGREGTDMTDPEDTLSQKQPPPPRRSSRWRQDPAGPGPPRPAPRARLRPHGNAGASRRGRGRSSARRSRCFRAGSRR